MVCTECLLLIFGSYSIGFILGSYVFHLFGNNRSKQTFCILDSLRKGYMRDSINRINNGQANHQVELGKSRFTNGTESL